MLLISGANFGCKLAKGKFFKFINNTENNIKLFSAPDFIKIEVLLIFGIKFGLSAKGLQ